MFAVLLGLVVGLPPYTHERTRITIPTDSRGYNERVVIRVYSTTSGRTVWKRTFLNPGTCWSADGRSIAVLDHDWGLTTWHAGGKVHRVIVKKPKDFGGETPFYEERMRWSPDKRRMILVVPYSMGDLTIDMGGLFVVRVSSGATQMFERGGVVKAEWVGNQRVKYLLKYPLGDGKYRDVHRTVRVR